MRGKVLKFLGRVFGTRALASKGAKINATSSTFWKKNEEKCIFTGIISGHNLVNHEKKSAALVFAKN